MMAGQPGKQNKKHMHEPLFHETLVQFEICFHSRVSFVLYCFNGEEQRDQEGHVACATPQASGRYMVEGKVGSPPSTPPSSLQTKTSVKHFSSDGKKKPNCHF